MTQDYNEWASETVKKIEAKTQSPFMDFVDCNEAWGNRRADEATDALDNLLDLTTVSNATSETARKMIGESVDYLRKFIERTRK